jgi:hypothetical protein
MKKYLYSMFIIFGITFNCLAQTDSTIISEGTSTIKVDAVSNEVSNVSGSVNITLQITALDTAYIDSLWFGETSIFTTSWNGTFTQTNLTANGNATATITANYNTNALPYYPKQFEVLVSSHNARNEGGINMAQIIVYFTPYNSTEIWSRDDFWALPRIWFMPEANAPEPARVFIPQNQIPVSDIVPNKDSTKTLYEYEHQRLVTLPNLPYRIIMSALPQAPAQQQSESRTTNFNGSISGNVIFKKRIDHYNTLVTCPFSGVHINLYYTEPNSNVNLIASSRIQHNGNYQLDFNTNVDGSINQISLWIGIVSDDGGINDNEFYNIRVHDLYNNAGKLYALGINQTTFNVSENGSTKTFSNPTEVSEPHRAPFQALHYAHNAYRFVRQSYSSTEMPNDLIIYLKHNGLVNSSHYNPILYNTPRIFLETGDDKLESVVYHEFGHHVMYRLQGDFYSQTGRIFKHPWTDEHTPREAWCEGWGYAFAQMCDLFYKDEDGESDWIKSIPTEDATSNMPPKDNSVELRDPSVYSNGNNGFKAEYFIACAIYDLFDGSDKFSGAPSSSYYDDSPSYNSQGRGGYKSGTDKVSMSFREIADFFLWVKNQSNKEGFNIYSFWIWLLSQHPSDCDLANINAVFRENRITKDVSDGMYSNSQMRFPGSNGSIGYIEESPSNQPIHGSALDLFWYGSSLTNYLLLFQNETVSSGTYTADDYIKAGYNVGKVVNSISTITTYSAVPNSMFPIAPPSIPSGSSISFVTSSLNTDAMQNLPTFIVSSLAAALASGNSNIINIINNLPFSINNLFINEWHITTQDNSFGDVVIPSNAHVTFEAANIISLEPGFITEENAEFTAQIKTCPVTNRIGFTEPLLIEPVITTQETPETKKFYKGKSIKKNDTTNEKNTIAEIKISPNPASQSITISSRDELKNILVFNLFGEQIYTNNNLGKYNVEIATDQLSNGVYVFSIETENNSKRERVIIQK